MKRYIRSNSDEVDIGVVISIAQEAARNNNSEMLFETDEFGDTSGRLIKYKGDTKCITDKGDPYIHPYKGTIDNFRLSNWIRARDLEEIKEDLPKGISSYIKRFEYSYDNLRTIVDNILKCNGIASEICNEFISYYQNEFNSININYRIVHYYDNVDTKSFTTDIHVNYSQPVYCFDITLGRFKLHIRQECNQLKSGNGCNNLIRLVNRELRKRYNGGFNEDYLLDLLADNSIDYNQLNMN